MAILDAETRLRRAITGLGMGTIEAIRAHADAWSAYEDACHAARICGNLGCDRPVVKGGFCAGHTGVRSMPATCDAARAGDRGGCDSDPYSVRVIGRRGEVMRGCVHHAAARLSEDHTYWWVSHGDIWGADRETYDRAGFRYPEKDKE